MKKNHEDRISPGNIVALWQLVRLTEKHTKISVQSAIEITLNSGLMGGAIPANEGLQLGLQVGYLKVMVDNLLPTEECKNDLYTKCKTEEPNLLIIRSILFKVVSLYNLDWLLFFDEDPEIFKPAIPDIWLEILEFGNLFDFDSEEVKNWWTLIFSKFQTYKEGQKIEIGKIGEKLTYEFEINRLKLGLVSNIHSYVKWASQIDDRFGYDILSKRGKLLQIKFDKMDTIQIEVKSSVGSNEDQFRFYVTKNEWNTAEINIESYYFYCWVSLNKENETAIGPYIIPAKKLKSHIPSDNSTICEWYECRFTLDLNTYKI